MDSDSLPPYDVLDRIVQGYVEEIKSHAQLYGENVDSDLARSVIRRIDAAEHKRHRSAPGVKITPRAFGTGRRMPVANGYKL